MRSKMNRAAVLSIALLMILGLLLIIAPEVYAVRDTGSLTVKLNLRAELAISLSKETIRMHVTPNPNGQFVYDTVRALVDTNNETGYSLYLNTEEEMALFQERYQDRQIHKLDKQAIITAENQDDFTMNKWGYAITEQIGSNPIVFNGIPNSSDPVLIQETESSGELPYTYVTVGARVNNEVYAGPYIGVLSFTAVTNYIP